MARQSHKPSADALAQIKLIAGAVVRVRCVGPNGAQEREGTLPELHPWIAERNAAGDNVYMVAQPTGPIAEGAFAKDTDITGVRCLYADGDESPLPEAEDWHVEPTFILVHPQTKRWWAFWLVRSVPLDRLGDLIRRIAAQYDSDPSISNPSRIVRLAGFDRWKGGKNFGPYELRRLSGATTEAWQHDNLPPAPAGTRKGKSRTKRKIALDYYGDLTPWDHEQAKRLVDYIWHGKLLKEYVGPFPEGERDDMTFKLFAEAKGRGIHPDAILAAVMDAGIDGGLDDS